MAFNAGTVYKPHRMKEIWQDRIYNNVVLFLIIVTLFLMLYP